MSILIKDATIVTQNEKRETIQGDILIKDNKIIEIKKNIKEKTEFVLNASNKIAIPGLINTHTHIAMTLFRGYGDGLNLQEWLTKKIWPAEAKLTPEAIYNGTLLGAMEMICSGTTTYNEMYLIGLDEIAKASEKAGIRGIICSGMVNPTPERDMNKELKKTESFVKKWKNKSELITPGVAPHALYTCTEELLIKSKELANKEKVLYHMHLSETRKELFDILKEKKKRPFEYLDSLGVLDQNSLFAHASWVSKKEIQIAGKKKVSISHNPVSNLKLATGGICPVVEYDAKGANITIGTDGAASNNSLDMLESMKFTALLQKHKYWNSSILYAQRVFDYATINGAKALRINAGSLEEGKLADIVLLDKTSPNLIPSHDIIANIVYSSNPSNITDVVVNGKIILEDNTILTINLDELKEKINQNIKDFT